MILEQNSALMVKSYGFWSTMATSQALGVTSAELREILSPPNQTFRKLLRVCEVKAVFISQPQPQ